MSVALDNKTTVLAKTKAQPHWNRWKLSIGMTNRLTGVIVETLIILYKSIN